MQKFNTTQVILTKGVLKRKVSMKEKISIKEIPSSLSELTLELYKTINWEFDTYLIVDTYNR